MLCFEEKLSTLDIRPDDYAHVKVKDQANCEHCKGKHCCFICPSNVFKLNGQGLAEADHKRCIECGACVLACPEQNIMLDYPRGGYGVAFHQG